MPSIGSETYRSSELPESATKETKIDEGAHAPEVIQGEDWPKPEVAPVFDSITPNGSDVPGPDVEVVLAGSNFNAQSIIVWNNGDETTEFVNDTELRTIVKPSTVQAPLPFTLPVYIRNGSLRSEVVEFTFKEAEIEEDRARSDKKHHRRR